jgi:DivIVA domain-containing protein
MLTPLDIQNAVFHRSFRGYNENEVDEFLDRVVLEYEQLLRENLALKEQLAGRGEAAAAGPAIAVGPVVATKPAAAAGEPAETGRLTAELDRLRLAVREERQRLEALRHQRRLFATQFRAMLESYQTVLLREVGEAGEAGVREPRE